MKGEIKQSRKPAHIHPKQKSPHPSTNPQHRVKTLTDNDILNMIRLGNRKCACCPKPQPCYKGRKWQELQQCWAGHSVMQDLAKVTSFAMKASQRPLKNSGKTEHW